MRKQTYSLILFLVIFQGLIAYAQENVTYVTSSDCTCSCTCKLPINNNNNSNNNNTNTNTNSTNTNSTNTNSTNTNSTNTNNNSNSTNNTNTNSTNTNNANSSSIKSIAYINTMSSWWGAPVLQQFTDNCYDVVILTFWLSYAPPSDAVLVYKNIYDYLGTDAYGKNSLEVQKTLQQMMQSKGKKLMISAFGDTDNPTNKDPTQVATDLANFANNLPYIDGIDIDYEDNAAIVSGTGVTWLITFTKVLRNKLNNKNLIVTHAPQAPYFSREYYSSGAYYKVHQEVGHLIDWYNVQFYNQGSTSYDSFEKLFITSGNVFTGTAYKEIVEKTGVPLNKLVLGKPVSSRDLSNTGLVDAKVLGQLAKRAQKEIGYTIPGFFIWQLSSDSNCSFKNKFFEGFNA